jgi:hypothetical protein
MSIPKKEVRITRDMVKKIALVCHIAVESVNAFSWRIYFIDGLDKSVGITFEFNFEKNARGLLKELQLRMNVPTVELKTEEDNLFG